MKTKFKTSLLLKVQLVASIILIVFLLISFLSLKRELLLAKKEINGYRKFFANYKRERLSTSPTEESPTLAP